MSFLPKLRNTSAPSRIEEVRFYGLDRTESARSGYFSDTRNVSSKDFPFISSRESRVLSQVPGGMKVLGIYSAKELCYVLGDGERSYFYFGGSLKGEWDDSAQRDKFMCELGGAVYIFPDKMFYKYKDENSIEEYSATHPKIGTSGNLYIKFIFNDMMNTNRFGRATNDVIFDAGDAVKLWAYDKASGDKVSLMGLPLDKGVVLSGYNKFKDFYVKTDRTSFSDIYECDAQGYIRCGYEFTHPIEYDELFSAFAADIKSDEIHEDDDGYQYLLFKQEYNHASNPFIEFIAYSFENGMDIKFLYTDSTVSKITPENAIIQEAGVKEFFRGNNSEVCAFLKFSQGTFNISSWDINSVGNNYTLLYDDDGRKVFITVSTDFPTLQGADCVNNRLWGYEGNTIHASSLGKPYIMNSYRGLSTDSWALETGIKRDFTGVIEYGTVPHFFTEDKIIKVYGDAPSSFRTAETDCAGVKSGSKNSLCVSSGVLYFLDRDGNIASYTGAYPTVISRKLDEVFDSGILADDGRFLYCFLKRTNINNDSKLIYTFDTLNRVWLYEASNTISHAVSHGNDVIMVRQIGSNYLLAHKQDTDLGLFRFNEAAIQSLIEFPVNDEGIFNQKKLKKILLKINAEAGTELCVEVKETEYPEYTRIFERIIKEGDGVLTIPVDCKRTLGYQIRITGKGKWRLEGVMRKVAIGSYKS